MKEENENEPEELRSAGYLAMPVRRRSDYRNLRHLAAARASRPSFVRRLARRIVVAWRAVRVRFRGARTRTIAGGRAAENEREKV